MHRISTAVLVFWCGCASVQPARDPDTISLSGALSNSHLTAGKLGELSARLKIDVQALKDVPRPQINVAVVIDTSGSMEGNAIRDAREAATALLASLSDGDRLALIAFDSSTRVLVPSTEIDRGALANIRAQIAKMEASGTTDLAGGLQAALAEIARGSTPNGINRIVLLSDGIPNQPPELSSLLEVARQHETAITALGLGLDYDETLLASLASKSGGTFRFLEDSAQVAKIFEEEVFQLKRVIARNTMLALKPGPGVTVATTPGVSTQVGANREIWASLGDLAENDQREIFVELTVEGRRDGANVELIDAVLSFNDPQTSQRFERRVFLSARATSDQALIEQNQNRDLQIAAARARIAAWTVDAISLARNGRADDARTVLEHAEAEMSERAEAWQANELKEEVRSIALVRQALPTYAASADDAKNVRRVHDRAVKAMQGSEYEKTPVTW